MKRSKSLWPKFFPLQFQESTELSDIPRGQKNYTCNSKTESVSLIFPIGNASSFTKISFTIFVPINPPPPNQQNEGFPLEFLLEGPQTELRTLSQNCEQTLQKLRTNRIMNKRALLILIQFKELEKCKCNLECNCELQGCSGRFPGQDPLGPSGPEREGWREREKA